MSSRMYLAAIAAVLFCSLLSSGCATFPGDLEGAFTGPERSAPASGQVSAFFLLRHVKQAHGLDVIPKLIREGQIVRDFDNLFVDAVEELSNLGSYSSFTEFPSDVSQPERLARRDSLMQTYDYVVRVRILEEYNFIRQFFANVASVASLSLVPMPYGTHYTIDVEVTQGDRQVATYRRSATKTMWVQMFLIFIQPFHTDTIVRERIYIDMLHDVFREMEADGVLR